MRPQLQLKKTKVRKAVLADNIVADNIVVGHYMRCTLLIRWSALILVLLIFFTTSTNHVTSLTVSFNESTYIVNKNDGLVQPVLVLNESSSTDITVQVIMADDITKFGE